MAQPCLQRTWVLSLNPGVFVARWLVLSLGFLICKMEAVSHFLRYGWP